MIRKSISPASALLIALVLPLILLGCRAKIAGDDYIIGPFPSSDQQKEREDRNQDLQQPAPDGKKSGQDDRSKEN